MLSARTPVSNPDTLAREPGWYLDGELIGGTLYCPTDAELAAGAQLDLEGAEQ